MKPFIKLCGVEFGNGLSKMSIYIKVPGDLGKLFRDLFWPPKKNPSENPKNDDTMDVIDNGDFADASDTLLGDIVLVFMKGIDSLDLEEEE